MKRVIIADDSSLARMFTARCLSVAGFTDFEIEEAQDGLEVVKNIKKNKPDLLITDLNMPEMDGLELLTFISENPDLRGIPTIVVTSAGNNEQRKILKELGAVDILSKPITPADISDAVGSYLDKGESYYD